MGRAWLGRTVLVACATGVFGVTPALAAPSPVSTSDPYDTPGCLALDASQEQAAGSINYRNSVVEPQVATDPTNGSDLVGAWQQDRWSDGGAHGLVAAYSSTSGSGWTMSPLPLSVCYHASGYSGAYLNYQRASDPWISIGPGTPSSSSSGSTVYAAGLSFDQTPYPGDPNARNTAVGATVSYDGGADWTHTQPVIADPCGVSGKPGYTCNSSKSFVLDDKESVTADPTQPGVAYIVWDRLLAPPATGKGFEHERAYFGNTYLSKTTDYGQTWSTPERISSFPSQDQTIGNQIVIDPSTHELYDFFSMIQNSSNAGQNRGVSVAFVKSSDGGASWTAPKIVAAEDAPGVFDPNNLNPYTNAAPAPARTGSGIPEVAINPTDGQLYLVWEDARFNGGQNDESVISTSSDGGDTWSSPARINAHTGEPAFTPMVAVDSSGTVAVTYYQWGTTVSGNEPTGVYIVHSTSSGSSSTPPGLGTRALVDGPFNQLAAPVDSGYFLGDYEGLTAASTGFVPFYVKTNCSDGDATNQPSCRALSSVLNPTSRSATDNNSTGVYAAPGS